MNKLKSTIMAVAILIVQGCTTTISGKVTDPEGKNIGFRDARVNVSRLTGNDAAATAEVLPVDDQGRFQTSRDLPAGRYLVEALVPGYRGNSVTIDLDGSQEVNLVVSPLAVPGVNSVDVHTELEVGRGTGAANLTPPHL